MSFLRPAWKRQRLCGSPLQRMRSRSTHSLPPLSKVPGSVRFVVDPPSHFEAVPGHGVQATVGGRPVLVGNGKLLERNGVVPGLEREAERLRAEAKTEHPAIRRNVERER